jgi:hypothetical protein
MNPETTLLTVTASAVALVPSKFFFRGSTTSLQPRIWGSGRFQYSVLKKGSTYVESSYPTAADVASSDFVYRGGFVYEITAEESVLLYQAGYLVDYQYS